MQLFPTGAQVSGRALPAAYGAVAAGGAVGATLRWAVGASYDVAPGDWPWPTLFVNVLGCLLVGAASVRVERGSLRWDAIVTGLLGGFTTMSSFAVELNDLVDVDRADIAVTYGAVTLAAGVGAVVLGQVARRASATDSSNGRSS